MYTIVRLELGSHDFDRLSADGLPNADNPSDHVPVGAAFRWAAASGDALSELRAAPPAPAAATKLAVAPEELLAEAAALAAAAPLTDEQRVEFEWVTAELPGVPAKGKVTHCLLFSNPHHFVGPSDAFLFVVLPTDSDGSSLHPR